MFSQSRLPADRVAFLKSLDSKYPHIPKLGTLKQTLKRTTFPYSATQPAEAVDSANKYFMEHFDKTQNYLLTIEDGSFEEHFEFDRIV